jgi:hypothetical protein
MSDWHISVDITSDDADASLTTEEAMDALHAHAPEIAAIINRRIEARTPRDTGALIEDEAYTVPGAGATLVTWFVGDDYQVAEWGRVYSAYQEGPPLGLSTYTPGEHQMYNRVGTDDLDIIGAWAQGVIELAKMEKKVEKMAEEALADIE